MCVCVSSGWGWGDVLEYDIFQVVLSTVVAVLSECQYDSGSHTHAH